MTKGLQETNQSNIINDTEEFTIFKNEDGTFKKVMKYKAIKNYHPSTQEEELKLFNVLAASDDNNEDVIQMKSLNNEQFSFTAYFCNPYTSFNEETGENEHGVITYFYTTQKQFIVTSSKSVYFFVQKLEESFNLNESEYFEVVADVKQVKKENGLTPTLTIVSVNK